MHFTEFSNEIRFQYGFEMYYNYHTIHQAHIWYMFYIPISKEMNPFEAFSTGAWAGAKIYIQVNVMLIAFVASLTFINATLGWCGDRVGIEGLSFEVCG